MIFDGCTYSNKHFVAVFAHYIIDKNYFDALLARGCYCKKIISVPVSIKFSSETSLMFSASMEQILFAFSVKNAP